MSEPTPALPKFLLGRWKYNTPMAATSGGAPKVNLEGATITLTADGEMIVQVPNISLAAPQAGLSMGGYVVAMKGRISGHQPSPTEQKYVIDQFEDISDHSELSVDVMGQHLEIGSLMDGAMKFLHELQAKSSPVPSPGDAQNDSSGDLKNPFTFGFPYSSFADVTLTVKGDDMEMTYPGAQQPGELTRIISDTVTIDLTGNSADLRSFYYSKYDTAGQITVKAVVQGVTDDMTYEWSVDGDFNNTATVEIENANSLDAAVTAGDAGVVQLKFTVLDSSGAAIASSKTKLSVPLFLELTGDTPKNIDISEEIVFDKSLNVAKMYFADFNVRIYSYLSSSSPPLSHCKEVITIQFTDNDYENVDAFGYADRKILRGFVFPNKILASKDISSFKKAIKDSKSFVIGDDGYTVFDLYVDVITRFIGQVVAHELGHLIFKMENGGGALNFDTEGHNNPAVIGGLMNSGNYKSFSDRTGIVEISHSFPDEKYSFKDGGFSAMAKFSEIQHTLIGSRFPIPPDFE